MCKFISGRGYINDTPLIMMNQSKSWPLLLEADLCQSKCNTVLLLILHFERGTVCKVGSHLSLHIDQTVSSFNTLLTCFAFSVEIIFATCSVYFLIHFCAFSNFKIFVLHLWKCVVLLCLVFFLVSNMKWIWLQGERCPHAFSRIDKTLNKGLVSLVLFVHIQHRNSSVV